MKDTAIFVFSFKHLFTKQQIHVCGESFVILFETETSGGVINYSVKSDADVC